MERNAFTEYRDTVVLVTLMIALSSSLVFFFTNSNHRAVSFLMGALMGTGNFLFLARTVTLFFAGKSQSTYPVRQFMLCYGALAGGLFFLFRIPWIARAELCSGVLLVYPVLFLVQRYGKVRYETTLE